MKSAQKAADASRVKDALDYYDRALEAAEQLATFRSTPRGNLRRQGSGLPRPERVERRGPKLWRLVELARAEGDRKVEGMALGGLGFAQMIAHDFEAAECPPEKRSQIAEELDDDADPNRRD